MKYAFLQINFIPGDIDGNVAAIITAAKKAKQKGAQICLTPALAVVGNMPCDAIYYPAFTEKAGDALTIIARELASTDIALICGCIGPDNNSGIYNQLTFIQGGTTRMICSAKKLFASCSKNEKSYFASGTGPATLEIYGKKIIFAIGEDAFPSQEVLNIKKERPDVVAILAARPFIAKEFEEHTTTLGGFAEKIGADVFFLNALGSGNGVIFPGRCQWFAKDGSVGARAKSFEDDICVFDTEETGSNVAPYPNTLQACTFEALSFGLRDYCRKTGKSKAIIHLTDKANSALVAIIAVNALGAENVTGIITSYDMYNKHDRCRELASNLGIKTFEMPIHQLVENYCSVLLATPKEEKQELNAKDIQEQIGISLAMNLARLNDSITLKTANKSELALGFGSPACDACESLEVLGNLYATEVLDLCNWINETKEGIIPEAILEMSKLGVKISQGIVAFREIDNILEAMLDERMPIMAVEKQGYNPDIVKQIAKLVSQSQYKRLQYSPVLKVNKPVCLHIPADGSLPF